MTDISNAESSNPRRMVVWFARAISYLVYGYVLLVEVVLFIGFVLLLFGANPTSSFVQWSYRNLDRAMEPFRGIFSSIELGIAGNDVPAVFESSIVFAMLVYAILAIALSALIDWLTRRLERIDGRTQAEREREDALIRAQALHDRATIIEAQQREAARAQAASTSSATADPTST